MMIIVIPQIRNFSNICFRITYETKQHIQTHVKIQPENECIDCECIKIELGGTTNAFYFLICITKKLI